MEAEDYSDVIEIDKKVLNKDRHGYYEMKFDKFIISGESLPTSLVAEDQSGKVIGFVMGEIYAGEYGLQEVATLDTIGVDPIYQKNGVGKILLKEFIKHLKEIGAKKVTTLMSSEEGELFKFFMSNQFKPSKTINLEKDI
mgnify:CR=1 FL=1